MNLSTPWFDAHKILYSHCRAYRLCLTNNSSIPVLYRFLARQAGTSLDSQSSQAILPASGLNFCARWSPVCADWRSWSTCRIEHSILSPAVALLNFRTRWVSAMPPTNAPENGLADFRFARRYSCPFARFIHYGWGPWYWRLRQPFRSGEHSSVTLSSIHLLLRQMRKAPHETRSEWMN